MTSIWITYAWEDNKDGDIDFIAQELESHGVETKLDRWALKAGMRLWEQIATYIQSPEESDAWVFVATQASLGSEPCKEEFAYALDRALESRGKLFPIIGLFLSPVDHSLISAAIKSRLYVSIGDDNWMERIISAAKGETPTIQREKREPYHIHIHEVPYKSDYVYSIEVRPRAGTWTPFIAAIPLSEREDVSPSIHFGPKNSVPLGSALYSAGSGASTDGKWWTLFADNIASPSSSYFIMCKKRPSKLCFGVKGGAPQFSVNIEFNP